MVRRKQIKIYLLSLFFDYTVYMIQPIELLTRKEYAKKHNITEATCFYACKRGSLSRVFFSWTDKSGKVYKSKFILPEKYVLLDREELMRVVRGGKA
jgi:hypothetical protein